MCSVPMNVASAGTRMHVYGGPTWGCGWWLGGTTEQPPDGFAGSSSTGSTTSSPPTTTSLFLSSVLPSSSMTWCSLCACPRPHTASQQGPAATSQAGGSAWRTVRVSYFLKYVFCSRWCFETRQRGVEIDEQHSMVMFILLQEVVDYRWTVRSLTRGRSENHQQEHL